MTLATGPMPRLIPQIWKKASGRCSVSSRCSFHLEWPGRKVSKLSSVSGVTGELCATTRSL